MSLSDQLSGKSVNALAKISVKIGNVYEITMDGSNGITPKRGDSSRNKYFVVLGFDSCGNVYGGVVINSKINANLPPRIMELHMPIKSEKYSFLRYDSFVDCSTLKTAPIGKFAQWGYLGEIDDEDVCLIIGAVRESPVESKYKLSLFGL